MNTLLAIKIRGGGHVMRARSFRQVLPLLLCLALAFIFAVPAQAQTCGLPNGGQITTSATYDLTADCTITAGSIDLTTAVTVTVNGNGYSVTPRSGRAVFFVNHADAILNLNNVVFSGGNRQGSTPGHSVLTIQSGTLNANGLTIRDSTASTGLGIQTSGTVTLTNVRFINNEETGDADATLGSALTVDGNDDTVVNINGATFSENEGQAAVVYVNHGAINFRGLICFTADNVGATDGSTPENYDKSDHATDTNVINTAGARISCTPEKKKKKEPTPTLVPTATPTAATCVGLPESTGIVVRAAQGLASGIQCQTLDGGGIGIPAFAENYIAAVDVWGWVVPGVEVCFPRAGRVFFLDAAMSPRVPALMQSFTASGMNCVSIDGAGALVLLPPE